MSHTFLSRTPKNSSADESGKTREWRKSKNKRQRGTENEEGKERERSREEEEEQRVYPTIIYNLLSQKAVVEACRG